MLDLFIKVKFAEASFDQDSMKNMFGILYFCDVSFVCSIFSKGMYGGSVH
jgi:hypothetical protein